MKYNISTDAVMTTIEAESRDQAARAFALSEKIDLNGKRITSGEGDDQDSGIVDVQDESVSVRWDSLVSTPMSFADALEGYYQHCDGWLRIIEA